MNFFSELKRRNVLRAAAFYAASAWLLVQVATQVFPFFRIAEWVVRWIIVAAAVGFPFWILFAWFYEWTPQGLLRESDVPATPSPAARQQRKNVDRWIIAMLSLAVVLLLTDKLVLREGVDEAGATPDKSIAVLPFVNMSSDQENEYFVDGLTEEILNRLAQIRALRVPGRTSSFAFKGRSTDLRQIGSALTVAHVLEGSVRKSGDRLRITAQLVRTADGFHLWSQTYDRKLVDVFAVQEEIARAIAGALSTPLGLDETARPARRTRDMDVYDDFLQARALLADRSSDKLRRALGLLTAAVERDPDFANGWAALAQARALSSYYLDDIPDPLASAEEAARKALALDDSIPMAHSALADVLRDRRDWIAAEREYQSALKLSPGEAETHNQYAQMLLKLGRMDGALQHALRACELEPLAWVPPTVVALVYLSRGDYEKGRMFLDRSVKISGPMRGFHARTNLLFALSQQDRDLARRILRLSQERSKVTWSSSPPSAQFINLTDQALAESHGTTGAAPDLGQALREMLASGQHDNAMPLSAVAVFVGQKEAALDALSVEAKALGNDVAGLIWTPVYRSLRSEPRFRDFLRAMKMPNYWHAAGWSEFCQPTPEQGPDAFTCQ